MTRVYLIGFMGSGKSTVGPILARRLGADYIDTDEEAERVAGCSINEIFRLQGERYFRDMESELLGDIVATGKCDLVIATGGGLPLREHNCDLMHRGGIVIYLRMTPRECYRRLQGDTTRPLLHKPDPLGEIERLMRLRDPIYYNTANWVVDVDGASPREIVHSITTVLKKSHEGMRK